METKKTYEEMESEKVYSLYQMILNLVDLYIDLQLNSPLVIDKKEPKQYPDVAFDCYVSSDKGQSFLRGLSRIMESVRTKEEKFLYGPNRYSRTEFFSKCFNYLIKSTKENINLSELEKIKRDLISDCCIERNASQYVKLAVEELSKNTQKYIIHKENMSEKAKKFQIGKRQ